MEWIGRRFYLFTIRLFLTLFQKEIRNSLRPPKKKKSMQKETLVLVMAYD